MNKNAWIYKVNRILCITTLIILLRYYVIIPEGLFSSSNSSTTYPPLLSQFSPLPLAIFSLFSQYTYNLQTKLACIRKLSAPVYGSVLCCLNARDHARGLLSGDLVHCLLVATTTIWSERQLASCYMVQCNTCKQWETDIHLLNCVILSLINQFLTVVVLELWCSEYHIVRVLTITHYLSHL